MECKETRELLSAHIDKALGLPEAIEIDKHLQTCLACGHEMDEQKALSAAIRNEAPYFTAPSHLEHRLKTALAEQHGRTSGSPRRSWNWFGPWHWLNAGTALASFVAVAWSVGLYLAVPSTSDVLADEVVAGHVRSLMVNHMADVASSDQHTVKPWFNGKLDFSPAVQDLAAQGFPLVGGRLDYLNHRPVAALVYRHRQHPINVYIWPTADTQAAAAQSLSRQGYHLVHWVQGGMVYWAISDVDAHELTQLVSLLQAD